MVVREGVVSQGTVLCYVPLSIIVSKSFIYLSMINKLQLWEN